MKHIKSQLVFAIVLLSTSCFATPKPEGCPSVEAIKSVGLHHADTSLAGWEVSSDEDHFGTKEVWKFVMLGDTQSPSEAEAIAKATAKISSLLLFSGPEKENDSWLCYYRIPNGDDPVVGIAGTEPNKH